MVTGQAVSFVCYSQFLLFPTSDFPANSWSKARTCSFWYRDLSANSSFLQRAYQPTCSTGGHQRLRVPSFPYSCIRHPLSLVLVVSLTSSSSLDISTEISFSTFTYTERKLPKSPNRYFFQRTKCYLRLHGFCFTVLWATNNSNILKAFFCVYSSNTITR